MTLSLPDNEAHLWFIDQADFQYDELQDCCAAWLSAGDKARYERFCFEQHRKQFLLGKMLVRAVLSEYGDVKPGNWVFTENAWGRPQLAEQHDSLGLFFNLSHSADRLVLAVSRYQSTGVDIEASTRKRRVSRIADRYFSRTEVHALREMEAQQQRLRFYELWTLKEAYIKARGLGLALPLQEFGFGFVEEDKLQFWVNPPLEDSADNWQFWQLDPGNEYQLALAIKPDASKTVERISFFQKTAISGYQTLESVILRQS